MAIHIPIAPAAGLRLVLDSLPPPSLPIAAPPLHLAALAEAPPNAALRVRNPYPVFTATAEGLLGNKGLKSARLTAWQYVIEQGGVAHSLAEIAVADFTGDPEQALAYASEYPSSYADELIEAIADAEALPEVAARDYELRILRVPALYVLALWLHGQNEEQLCLVSAKRATLEAGRWVNETELVGHLRPLADVRRVANDR